MSSQEVLHINFRSVEPGQSPETPSEGQFPMYPIHHESAKLWVDLSLHLSDLESVLVWLELLCHKHTLATPEAEALWTAALTIFFKCFQGSKSRKHLDFEMALANEPEEGREQFKVLKNLRNKTVQCWCRLPTQMVLWHV
jgi:hypothetical protein